MTTQSVLVDVTTYYLEIPSRADAKLSLSADPALQVIEAREALVPFYRFLYSAVGSDYNWTDRLAWSDEQLQEYLQRPNISLHVLYVNGTPAGYIELDTAPSEPGTEVAYFGLIPQFHGKGYGKHLLSYGIQKAFEGDPERVWVHTCSLDGAYALRNYQARGFQIYKTTTHQQLITKPDQA